MELLQPSFFHEGKRLLSMDQTKGQRTRSWGERGQHQATLSGHKVRRLKGWDLTTCTQAFGPLWLPDIIILDLLSLSSQAYLCSLWVFLEMPGP